MPTSPSPPPSSPRKRLVALLLICLALALAVVAYAVRARGRAARARAAAPVLAEIDDPSALAAVSARPFVAFVNTQLSAGNGHVALVPLDALDGPRYLTPLRCDRVYVAGGHGACLASDRGMLTRYYGFVFDAAFAAKPRMPLQGFPSRVRVSPDGRYAAFTVFVSGDSYSNHSFSTRTQIVDVAGSHPPVDLEQFTAYRDGKTFKSVDFNYWGVTFLHDSNRFYATLGTGGHMWLVEGRVAERDVHVVADGIECPSLSPDDRRVVFKRRQMENSRLTWRLHVLDLATKTDTALAETRSVDDQASWLDAGHVLYAVPAATGAGTDVWMAAADGGGTPRLFLKQAYSPAVSGPAPAAPR